MSTTTLLDRHVRETFYESTNNNTFDLAMDLAPAVQDTHPHVTTGDVAGAVDAALAAFCEAAKSDAHYFEQFLESAYGSDAKRAFWKSVGEAEARNRRAERVAA